MSKIYSLDLREKVVQLVESGVSHTAAAKIFNISRLTIGSWIRLKRTTGLIKAKEGYQKGHSQKITDLEAFKQFAEQNKHDSLRTLEQKLGNMSDTTIGRAMKKIGYSKKKELWVQRT